MRDTGIWLACLLGAAFALLPSAHAEVSRAPNVASSARTLPSIDLIQNAREAPDGDRPPGSKPGDGGPSPVVFPAQNIPLRFNHTKHVKQLGMPCTSCHDKAKTSQKSRDLLLPQGARCDACHGTDHTASKVTNLGGEAIGECSFCHTQQALGGGVARVKFEAPNLRFDHAAHVKQGMECSRCHGQVENVGFASVDQLPRMRACLDCHHEAGNEKGKASGACATCHLTEASGMMKTEFKTGEMLPPEWLHDAEHGPDWLERHKRVAGDDSRFCANCHSERFCTSCHDGNVKPRQVHPNDWIDLHPIAARQNDPTCTSCHRQQSFCVSCHERAGVTMSGPYANFEARGRFHPPPEVWSAGVRGPGHHAWEAERNLNACVSCHKERDCASCHATAAVGGRGATFGVGDPGVGQRSNPHPAGFKSRCGKALRSNARPCLVCHDPGDSFLGKCR